MAPPEVFMSSFHSHALSLAIALSLPVAAGCSSSNNSADAGSTPRAVTATEAAPVLAQYARGALALYGQSHSGAQGMKSAIDAMLAAPSAQTLTAARQAWLAARNPYGETEVFRFYGGPIDDEDAGNVEGRINAWPMDENYVDYVMGSPMAGIINNTTMFPALTREALVMLNEQGGETNIATGWHAVEFLLWGQDLSATGPGDRPATDFALTGGTASNQARRREYLTLVTEQLVADLDTVRTAWAAGNSSNYAARFTGSASSGALTHTQALTNMLTGMGSLSGAELAGERMTVAYEERDQEDEHSCFSDNTHNDILRNALGIENVYLGRYGTDDGAGLDDLVRARDPALDTRMRAAFATSLAAIRAIPTPFDQAIVGGDNAEGRMRVRAAIDALRAQTRVIEEVAAVLQVPLQLEAPADAGM